MAEIYLLADSASRPQIFDKQNYLGVVDYELFKELQSIDVLSNQLDYYTDFRISFESLVGLNKNLISKMKADNRLNEFKEIIEKALRNKSGLFILAD